MQQPEKKEDKLTIAQNIEQFVMNYRKQLLIGVSVIVVALIVFGIVTQVQSRRLEEYTERVEQAEELFGDYLRADEDARTALGQELEVELDEIISSMGNRYPGLRALMIYGEYHYNLERFDRARDTFKQAADQFGNTYLAPVALMNAAVASEEAGDLDQAISLYQRVVDRYVDSFHGVSRALLNIGRLYEAQGNTQAAIGAYEQLTADFSETEWAKLAQTRIIQLEIGM